MHRTCSRSAGGRTKISLGSSDVYKVHAVYESLDDNSAKVPFITMQDATIFQKGTIIEGVTSKAKARVVNFNSVSYVCHFVYENDKFFQLGERAQCPVLRPSLCAVA